MYMNGYIKDVSKRGPGFGIQLCAAVVLLLGALVGIVMRLVH
jgi:hypothetical protein